MGNGIQETGYKQETVNEKQDTRTSKIIQNAVYSFVHIHKVDTSTPNVIALRP
jgi:hypothetical protein